MKFNDSRAFVGTFKNGLAHGFGYLKGSESTACIGEIKDGHWHGKVTSHEDCNALQQSIQKEDWTDHYSYRGKERDWGKRKKMWTSKHKNIVGTRVVNAIVDIDGA